MSERPQLLYCQDILGEEFRRRIPENSGENSGENSRGEFGENSGDSILNSRAANRPPLQFHA